MTAISKRPRPHNKPLKDVRRPFSKGSINHSIAPADNMDVPAVSVKSPPLAMSQTEQANRLFLSEVQKIDEVITAKPYGGRTLAEQSIAVVVPAMRSSASRQVFELEGAILRAYPDARLNVRVIGLEERGLDLSQVEAVLPE